MRYLSALCCLFALLLFSPEIEVRAQTETPTPSSTYQPLYPSSTPQPTLDKVCATGLPAGWGTVTPSLLWSAECGFCLQVLTPTATYPATVTPVGYVPPTSTPGASPTPNPGQPGYGLGYWYQDKTHIYHTINTTNSYEATKWVDDAMHYGKLVGLVTETIQISGTNTEARVSYGIDVGVWSNAFKMTTTARGTGVYVLWADWPTSVSSVLGMFGSQEYWRQKFETENAGWVDGRMLDSPNTNKIYDYWDGGTGHQTFRYKLSGVSGGQQYQLGIIGYIWGRIDPIEYTSYCTAVNGGGGEQGLGVGLPEVRVGVGVCYGVTSFTIPFSTLNIFGFEFEDWTFPGLQLCFKPISFSDISLFGVTVSIDWLAAFMVAALIVRWVLRS